MGLWQLGRGGPGVAGFGYVGGLGLAGAGNVGAGATTLCSGPGGTRSAPSVPSGERKLLGVRYCAFQNLSDLTFEVQHEHWEYYRTVLLLAAVGHSVGLYSYYRYYRYDALG